MKLLILLFSLISTMCFADDCYYAYTASCNQESIYKWAEINFVVSTKFVKNKPSECPESAIVVLKTSMMLSEKGIVGKFCNSNEDFEFYTSESPPLAVAYREQNLAVMKSKEFHQQCIDETYDERCVTVNEFKSVSIQPYMDR